MAEASSKFARKFLVIPKQQRKRPAFPLQKAYSPRASSTETPEASINFVSLCAACINLPVDPVNHLIHFFPPLTAIESSSLETPHLSLLVSFQPHWRLTSTSTSTPIVNLERAHQQ